MDKQPLVKKPELTPKPPTFDAGFKCWGVCLTSFHLTHTLRIIWGRTICSVLVSKKDLKLPRGPDSVLPYTYKRGKYL